MIRGKWLLLLGVIIFLLILLLGLRVREQCPEVDQIWVMSDQGWLCIRQGTVRR